jgi:hypothetical protein
MLTQPPSSPQDDVTAPTAGGIYQTPTGGSGTWVTNGSTSSGQVFYAAADKRKHQANKDHDKAKKANKEGKRKPRAGKRG